MADELVQAVIKHWAPRLIAQGVDYNDYVRTTSRIERWDDWCLQWCVTGDEHAELAAQAQALGRTRTAGEAYIAAALAYHFGKFVFQDHPDEYESAAWDSIRAHQQGLALLDPDAERIEIAFESMTMVGILRRPRGVERPALVLLLPGLDSTKEEFFHWEEIFLKRGMATCTLEGPGQGEAGLHSHIRADYEKPVSAALDILDRRQDLDNDRIAAAGVSLGGYYALRAAAYEPRLKAVVENCGPWNWAECWDGLPDLTRRAYEYHSGARDPSDARQRAAQLSLEEASAHITQPVLIIHGRQDRIIPWQQGEQIARAIGQRATFMLYENANHVCNNIPYIYRPLTADWLAEKLG